MGPEKWGKVLFGAMRPGRSFVQVGRIPPFFRPGNFPETHRVLTLKPAVNDDAQLIEKTLRGESAAFGQLVQKYQGRLYNTLVHVVGNTEDARDVVQDALVQAFVKLDTFRGSSAFYTWLYRIAFNVAASHRRRKKPTVSVDHTREIAGEEPIDKDNDPHAKLEQGERFRQVHEALAQLSEEHRVVLVLREIDGCCYETIADVLDLPIGTVRSRLHRGRLQLKDLLKGVVTLDD